MAMRPRPHRPPARPAAASAAAPRARLAALAAPPPPRAPPAGGAPSPEAVGRRGDVGWRRAQCARWAGGRAPTSSRAASPSLQVAAAAAAAAPDFAAIDALIAANVRRAQAALAGARLGAHHFAGSTGYGRGDAGRAALDHVRGETSGWSRRARTVSRTSRRPRPLLVQAVAALMGTETALARPHFQSGTHAIAAALFGALRPGDELLIACGRPYDTLEEVIGTRGAAGGGEGGDAAPSPRGLGTLLEWGVTARVVPAAADGGVDCAALEAAVGQREWRERFLGLGLQKRRPQHSPQRLLSPPLQAPASSSFNGRAGTTPPGAR